ncbi:uncharacterized protein LOC122393433 [Amphibalanus amphitrite]|uniref:uncharacterized protein LOC122393433 n=1 Tax=Amphibalanus amphitrite TaxID=1232801 RepID=UPI001C906D58|nr:uncharacterized protein LOC122393433 [Amphibalanus amphitrite]
MFKFHAVHGSHVALENDDTCATRREGFCNGITFSSVPMARGEQYHLRVSQVSDWSGALRLGVTWHDPATLTSLPRYSFPDLIRRPGFWVRTIREQHLSDGARIHFWLTLDGVLHVSVNHQQVTRLATGVGEDRPLWALVDVYGNTQSVQVTGDEETPLEILARGQAARDLYRQVRRAGTVPVYRSRLFIIGNCGAGKTTLRHLLLGSSAVSQPPPTAGLDSSDLFTFPVDDPSAWQPDSASVGSRRPSTGRWSSAQREPEEIEEEYQTAIARNVVRELLKDRKSREMAKRKSRSSSRHFSSTFRVNLSRSSLNKVMPRKDFEVTDEGALKELPPEIVRLVEEMLAESPDNSQERNESPEPGQKQQVTVSVWDWSGDPEYEAVLLPLLGYRGVYLLVFDASQPLDGPATITTWAKGQASETPVEGRTRLDQLLDWLQLVHTAATPGSAGEGLGTGTLAPPVLLVGVWSTQDDRPPPTETELQQSRQLIRQALEGRLSGRHVHSQVLTVPISGDAAALNALRGCLGQLTLSQAYMGEKVPVRWLRLEEEVARRVRSGLVVATWPEMETMAAEHDVAGEELTTFLRFHHDQGSLLLHGDGPHRLVLLSPQWLVQLFADVINAKRKYYQSAPSGWRRLESEGVVEAALLSRHWDQLTNSAITLGVLRRLGLVCPLAPPPPLYDLAESVPLPELLLLPSLISPQARSSEETPRSPSDSLTLFIDFCGFLTASLVSQLVVRLAVWTQESSHRAPHVSYGRARLFVDGSHELLLTAAPLHLARIQVTVARISVLMEDGLESYPTLPDCGPTGGPSPDACLQIHRRLDSTLAEVRAALCRRLQWQFTVECPCGRPCTVHRRADCPAPECLHTLPLNQCLSGDTVYCDFRRVSVEHVKRCFERRQPDRTTEVSLAPVLPARYLSRHESLSSASAPQWVKQAAKLLNAGGPGSDWMAVAKKIGYREHKISEFDDCLDPGLALITDWMQISGNNGFSLDMLCAVLDSLARDDICAVLRNVSKPESPAPVFISYQWDHQEEAVRLRGRLESTGLRCWMDVGQMGGGDLLYEKIYQGISGAKVFVACLSQQYLQSQLCLREAHLADLLQLKLVPVLLEKMPWPPAGSLALVFSQLVYVDFAGVGCHGGRGRSVDWARRADELVRQVSQLLPVDERTDTGVVQEQMQLEQVTDAGTGGSDSDAPAESPPPPEPPVSPPPWQPPPAAEPPSPPSLSQRLKMAAVGCLTCRIPVI